MKKRLISTSLYGGRPKYVQGALANCRLVSDVYPDWTMRVYVEKGHPVIPQLVDEGAEVITMPKADGVGGMYWRFLAASDPDVERVIFRDLDSRLNVRERAAVDAWIAADRAAHIMRDHRHHAAWQMFGGMWGIKGGTLENIDEMIWTYQRWVPRPRDDRYFLIGNIYPLIEGDCLEHGLGFNAVPFPKHPSYDGFVGQVFDDQGIPDWPKDGRPWWRRFLSTDGPLGDGYEVVKSIFPGPGR